MAETDTIIRISAQGADQASSAIGSVTRAMQGIGAEHNDLVSKFSQRFEHIGLQLFAGEALRANGVGMETRAVVQTLGLALNSVGGAFGAAAGPIFLIVSALTAVIGIVEKVIAHHKDLQDQLDKTNKATHEQLDKTNEAIASIQDYEKEVGDVQPALKKWEESEKSLQKAQVERQIAGDRAQISSLTELMNQESRRQEQLRDQISDEEKQIKQLKDMSIGQEVLIAQKARLDQLNQSFKEGAMTVAEQKAKIDELILDVKLLGSNGTDDIKKLTEAHKAAEEEAQKELKAYMDAAQKEADADTARYQHWAELRDKQQKQSEQIYTKMAEQAGQTFKSIDNEQSKAFAQMLVEGKSFSDAFTHFWRDLAEQVIAQIERMIVEWGIWMAATGGTGIGGGAGTFSGFVGKSLGFAEGGSVLVNQPTMFLAGEAGQPEIASFTPLSKLGSGSQSADGFGSQGTGIQIGTVQTNIYGVQDPDAMADTVGRKILERIRGMGEQNMVRSA